MRSEHLGAPGPEQALDTAQAPWSATAVVPLGPGGDRLDEPIGGYALAAEAEVIPTPTAETAPVAPPKVSAAPAAGFRAVVPGGERRRAVTGKVQANVYHDPKRETVTLLLDESHAEAVIYAVRSLAADYEAHAREVRAVAATLPSDSYGATNRLYVAIRHERIASRLRRVESTYRLEVDDGLPPE